MSAHHHICPRCHDEFTCHAPIIKDWDSDGERVCVRALDHNPPICENCELDAARAELPPEFRDAPVLAKREGQ